MSLEATEETEENAQSSTVSAAESPQPADAAPQAPADLARSADPPDFPGQATPVEGAKAAGDPGSAGAEAGEPGELSGAVELPDPVEPTELVGRAEPVERDEPRRRGRGLALAVLFVIAALAIVGGAVGTVGALTHGFKKPVTIKYRESAVFKLHTGDCVNTPNGQVVSVLPCSTPHQAEVFATFSLPASAWPGTATVREQASSGCASQLAGYLNPQLAISLSQSYVFPDQVAWKAGTRTVICEVQATSGQLTGSVRGASLPVL
jgi:hypothetical protein